MAQLDTRTVQENALALRLVGAKAQGKPASGCCEGRDKVWRPGQTPRHRMARFADALETHKAPAVLGDVSLRYEPSMLIGETAAPTRTIRPTFTWTLGLTSLLLGAGLLLTDAPLALAGGLISGGGALIGAGVWLDRLERRRRRFVANFATNSLRLDFATPVAGYARTLVVPFDAVKALALVAQEDGARCLLVDFTVGPSTLREVLVAFIPAAQDVEAERVERVLRGAFGLGTPPKDSPFFDQETSTFEGA